MREMKMTKIEEPVWIEFMQDLSSFNTVNPNKLELEELDELLYFLRDAKEFRVINGRLQCKLD